MGNVTIDYETFYVKPTPTDDGYSVRDLGNWRYCNDERFDPFLLAVYDGSESWVGHPSNFNWDALAGQTLIAHNAGFDRSVTRRLVELGKAPTWLNKNEWQCTANMSSALFSTRALAESVLVSSGRSISKDVRDAMNKKHWADIVAAGLAKQVAEYGLRDVVECHGLFAKHGHLWSQFERDLSELTMRQCSRGVAVNVGLLEEYRGILVEVIFTLERSFPWVQKGAKPTSPKSIAEQCREVGIPAPPVKGDDEDAFLAWESKWRAQYPWVAGAGTWRSLNKLLKSLETLKERLRPDGTVDFSLLYFGAHTGRWSGGGGGFNMQNLRKEPLYLAGRTIVDAPRLDPKSAEFKAWLVDKYVLDIRCLFIARPGKKFIICDLSQVEPRVLAWLSGNTELLDNIRNGFAYYQAYARLCEGWKGQPMTSKEFKKAIGGDAAYTLLKNKALGLGYGMGVDRFVDYAGVPVEEAEKAVKSFRETNPRIVSLWNKLDQGLQQSVGGDFEMELPSGRTMTYRNVRRERRMKLNKKEGKMESRSVLTAGTGLKRKEFYGGFLTENITQAVARDVFGTHLLALEKNIGDVIFHVHDEAIVEVDRGVAPADVEEVMSKTPEWLPGCPLAAEAQESPHYLK